MRVRVQRKHIREGKRKLSDCCPISLAIKDAGSPENGIVDLSGIQWKELNGDTFIETCLPDQVQKFTHDFDKGLPVKPFKFSLNPTSLTSRSI